MKFNAIRLFSAASGLALISATSAFAQAAPAAPAEPADEEIIIVTGFRASLADALSNKQRSNLIIESVTAEDIGEFPDQNIAESLQRLPGVQIDRENGQGTKVRIRGLDQNVVTLNGELFLTGLELFRIGEGNFTQTDSLEGIPSELIGGVDVYKSPDASILEGGLGGLVNLKTRSALSLRDGYLLSANLKANRGNEGDFTPQGSMAAGFRFSDSFAILGSLSYDRTDITTDFVGGDNRGGWRFNGRPVAGGTFVNAWSPEYRYATLRDQERERIGASLNAELAMTDSLTLRGDWLHSEITILTKEASLKFPFANEGATYASGVSVDGSGIVNSGTVTANSAEGISFVQNAEAKTDNFQLTLSWDNGGPLKADFGAFWSKSSYESTSANNDVRYTQYGVRNGTSTGLTPNSTAPTTMIFTYINGENPTFTVGNPGSYTTPSSVFAKSHWLFGETSDVENRSYRADFTLTPSFGEEVGLSIRTGLRYATREVDSTFGRYLADYSAKGELPTSAQGKYLTGFDSGGAPILVNAATPGAVYIDWTPFGYFQDGAIGLKKCDTGLAGCGRFGNSPAVITPYQTAATNPGRFETATVGGITALFQDRDQMENGLAWISSLYPSTPFTFFKDPLNSFKIQEKTTSGYFMVDVGNPGDAYHLNAGVRVIGTEFDIDTSGTPATPLWWGTDSWNGVLKNPDAINTVREYTDVLPSFNAVFNINETDKLRFSAARVVARQNLFDLGRGSQFDFTRVSTAGPDLDKFEFTRGNGGNPELEPYRANQFDISFERYFGSDGLISAGFFYKAVDSFTQNDTVTRIVADQTSDGSTPGPYASPTNGEGGKVKGLEFGAQYAFENGFGFTGNYTYSDSETPASNTYDKNLPLPGVSKHAFNVTGYYEADRFAGRLSYAWRDEYFNGNFQVDTPANSAAGHGATSFNLGRYVEAYGQLDGQLSFDVTDSFQISVEGINLTEAETIEHLQFANLPFRYLSGDRRVVIGGRIKFGG